MLSTLLPVLLAFHAAPPPVVSRPLVIQQSRSFAASSRSVAPRMSFDIGVALYEAQLSADALVKTQLASLTPLSALVLYSAGLVTSLTPCCLSMLPLTVAYLGGLEEDDEGVGGSAGNGAALPAFAFSVGLALAFAALGTAAASLGAVYGDAGGSSTLDVLRAAASLVAIALGLNLLQLLPFAFPTISIDTEGLRLPRVARSFLFGASSALVASPCASPVLATILGYVATLGDPLLGGVLLLCHTPLATPLSHQTLIAEHLSLISGALLSCYTFGYTTPVLLAGVAAGTARELSKGLEGGLDWVSPLSGAALLAFGTYSGLQAAFGAV